MPSRRRTRRSLNEKPLSRLGFQLVSHFTSDGRHDLADLYQETTRRIAR